MLVFVPPAVIAVPAILARFVQFMTRVIGLAAVAAMIFDGFMKTMIGLGDAPLAIFVRSQTWGASEEQETRKCRTSQRDLPGSKNS